MSYIANILAEAEANRNFRKVLYTGDRTQLVVMEVPPGGEIGAEVHEHVEQTLFIFSGVGRAEVGGDSRTVHPGDVIVVKPGTKHNFLNEGTAPLKLYTVYAPPNHLDGTVHRTKEEADADKGDEDFGHHAG
ncbi:cupin domain-containing protein [Candidatus Parcubacteria bacterium]|nr:cupin domain-containing protein [Candidatus Parcubacteria bacterium]